MESSFSRSLKATVVLCLSGLAVWFSTAAALLGATTDIRDRPDILFIVVDDLNDWISLLDPAAPIPTPNLERLARRGMLFTRAYCASPACNPSRTAALTGLRPATTGVYGNASDWRQALPRRRTVMQQFKAAGYEVKGAGKIFHHHHNGAFHDDASFDEFQALRPQSYPPQKLNGGADYGSRNTDWGKWPLRDADTVDASTVDYCLRALADPDRNRPLFLACGLFRPHSPFFAPAPYHEPFQDLKLPDRDPDDWTDLPPGAVSLLKPKRWFWKGLMRLEARRPGSWRAFVQAYAACVAFADAQVGRLLDALDRHRLWDRTVIVLWSDHGFHLGEKNHLEKFALWEKTTHIPLIIVAPGLTRPGSRCDRPVDLMSLYPTLLELGNLPPDPQCDSRSLVPLLRQPDAPWNSPALTTYLPGNHSVRSDRWRYIRYANGDEELYDHRSDPDERDNLAAERRFADILSDHRKWLPAEAKKPIGNLKNK